MAPFVEMRLQGQGMILTVGNKSNPAMHRACIKSFQCGSSVGGGVGFKCEIISEDYETFRKLMHALNKTVRRTREDTLKCSARWGWILTDCDGNTRVMSNEDVGPQQVFTPQNVQVAFENGIMKMTLEATDFQRRFSERSIEENQGDDGNKKTLKQALRDLFQENDPSIDVEFENAEGTGEFCFRASDGGCDGPRATWTSDQQNALATARKWILPLNTDNDPPRGIIIQYTNAGTPKVVFKEDPVNTDRPCCEHNLGTYIVNGGNCTAVISFSPTIDYLLAGTGEGGTSGTTESGAGADSEPAEDLTIEQAGPQSTPAISRNSNQWRPGDVAAERLSEAVGGHDRANSIYELRNVIEAELKIIGDPHISYPLGATGYVGKSVSIIVVNPFYLGGGDDGCTWLAQPVCHPTLSNKRWMILGVDHQIQAGSYVTTLKVNLPAPNKDIDMTDPLGGAGCGNETFDNANSQPDIDEF